MPEWPVCELCLCLGVADPRYVPGEDEGEGCPWHMERPKVVRGSEPWQQRPWAYDACECGAPKFKRAAVCRACADRKRGEATGYKTRCACGRTKDSGNAQCKHCRYPEWSRRQGKAA